MGGASRPDSRARAGSNGRTARWRSRCVGEAARRKWRKANLSLDTWRRGITQTEAAAPPSVPPVIELCLLILLSIGLGAGFLFLAWQFDGQLPRPLLALTAALVSYLEYRWFLRGSRPAAAIKFWLKMHACYLLLAAVLILSLWDADQLGAEGWRLFLYLAALAMPASPALIPLMYGVASFIGD